MLASTLVRSVGLFRIPSLVLVVERLNSFHRSIPASCSGSFLGFFASFQKDGLRFPNGALKVARGV
jgi:hypothetical protein